MDEYSAGGGGKLKLKGSKVSDGRVKKKKSKKSSSAGTGATTGTGEKVEEKRGEDAAAEERARSVSGGAEGEDGSHSTPTQSAKTEAERKHEEMRRKRVCCIASIAHIVSRSPTLPYFLLPSRIYRSSAV
jgi:protein FAM32A